ncbi:MAG TPA: hypothetical protein VJY47_01135 [Candidatus Dojkabacteria bacterium]|nr:hypothetical protein [Candidatus Dojkabacteria bacterium]
MDFSNFSSQTEMIVFELFDEVFYFGEHGLPPKLFTNNNVAVGWISGHGERMEYFIFSNSDFCLYFNSKSLRFMRKLLQEYSLANRQIVNEMQKLEVGSSYTYIQGIVEGPQNTVCADTFRDMADVPCTLIAAPYKEPIIRVRWYLPESDRYMEINFNLPMVMVILSQLPDD